MTKRWFNSVFTSIVELSKLIGQIDPANLKNRIILIPHLHLDFWKKSI